MSQLAFNYTGQRFNGSDYDHQRDAPRLGRQLTKIFDLMKDGKFRTLKEIETATGEPPASISAQLRHLKKIRFGSHTINKNYLGDGLYEYQLKVNGGGSGMG